MITSSSIYAIDDTTKYPNYNTDDNLVFSDHNTGIVNYILHDILYKHKTTKDGRCDFLILDTTNEVTSQRKYEPPLQRKTLPTSI